MLTPPPGRRSVPLPREEGTCTPPLPAPVTSLSCKKRKAAVKVEMTLKQSKVLTDDILEEDNKKTGTILTSLQENKLGRVRASGHHLLPHDCTLFVNYMTTFRDLEQTSSVLKSPHAKTYHAQTSSSKRLQVSTPCGQVNRKIQSISK